MSKKKSRAWDRKVKGEFGKGISPYRRISETIPPPDTKRWSKRAWRRRAERRVDEQSLLALRQESDAGLDWVAVKTLLDSTPHMTLDQAKQEIRNDITGT